MLRQGKSKFAAFCLDQLDILDPAWPVVHTSVSEFGQVHVDTGLLQSIDLGDSLRKASADVGNAGGFGMEAKVVLGIRPVRLLVHRLRHHQVLVLESVWGTGELFNFIGHAQRQRRISA